MVQIQILEKKITGIFLLCVTLVPPSLCKLFSSLERIQDASFYQLFL